MTHEKFSLTKRIKSFVYAFNGIKILIREEHNARIHLFAALMVIIAGIVFKIAVYEWVMVIFAVGFVITLEAINSSIENIADFISPEKHEQIKKIKDLAAAAVFISAITALAIGTIIFLPKILSL